MIYSDDINKICGLCTMAKATDGNEDELFCTRTKKSTTVNNSCAKFKYDIFKKPVRRKRRLKTNFTPEDFSL